MMTIFFDVIAWLWNGGEYFGQLKPLASFHLEKKRFWKSGLKEFSPNSSPSLIEFLIVHLPINVKLPFGLILV